MWGWTEYLEESTDITTRTQAKTEIVFNKLQNETVDTLCEKKDLC